MTRFLVGCAIVTALAAQTPYSVASIKRSASDSRVHGFEFLPGGHFRSSGMPLFMVLGIAYDLPTQSIEAMRMRIKGMPDWMMSEQYDIDAIAERGTPSGTAKARNQRIQLMLQAVLADRLKLKARQDMEVMPVYAMRVGARGVTLAKAPVSEEACSESAPFAAISDSATACHLFLGGVGRGIRGFAVDLADLAHYASNWSDLPIVDETGLAGLYSIQTEGWATKYNDDPARPTLEEVFARMGLKLLPTKAAVEVLAIESVQRPSEN